MEKRIKVIDLIEILTNRLSFRELQSILLKYLNSKLIEYVINKLADRENVVFKTEENSEFGKNYYSRLR
jgi:hypothetical protein